MVYENGTKRLKYRWHGVGLLLLCWACLMGIGGTLLLESVGYAQNQQPSQDETNLPGVDVDNFPQLTANFHCGYPDAARGTINIGDMAVSSLTDTVPFTNIMPLGQPVFLREDGTIQIEARLATSLLTGTPPSQVAIFLDLFYERDGTLPLAATELISKAGPQNDLIDYLNELGDSGIFNAGQDEFGIFLPDGSLREPRSLLATNKFTRDINRFFYLQDEIMGVITDTARLNQERTTALIELLVNTVEILKERPSTQRTLFVFSDGTDEISRNTELQLIEAARAISLTIHTVYIETGTPGDKQRLERIAKATNGDLLLARQSSAIRQSLRESFRSQYLCQFRYRTRKAEPGKIEIVNKLGQEVAEMTVPTITIEPPIVTTTIEPQAHNANLINDGLPTTTFTVSVVWDLGDQPNRKIESIRYDIDGPRPLIRLSSVPPSTTLTQTMVFSTLQLITGSYVAKVTIEDELGLEGIGIAPFQISAPPATAEDTTSQEEQSPESAPPTWYGSVYQWTGDQISNGVNYVRDLPRRLVERPLSTLLAILVAGIMLLFLLALLLSLFLFALFRLLFQSTTQAQQASSDRTAQKTPAALVRTRTDPNAPPLLQVVPIVYQNGSSNGAASSLQAVLRLPESLYHPVKKKYEQNENRERFSSQYESAIVYSKDTFRIVRNTATDSEQADQVISKQAEINVMVAETSKAVPLLDDDNLHDGFALHDGDIVQLGETHYRFVELSDLESLNRES